MADKQVIEITSSQTMNIPSGLKLGVQGDNEVTRLYFSCPRYPSDSVDLYAFATKYFAYVTPNGNIATPILVQNEKVDGDTLTFDVPVTGDMTKCAGNVGIALCFKNGSLDWNVHNAEIECLSGYHIDNPIQQYPDLAQQIAALVSQGGELMVRLQNMDSGIQDIVSNGNAVIASVDATVQKAADSAEKADAAVEEMQAERTACTEATSAAKTAASEAEDATVKASAAAATASESATKADEAAEKANAAAETIDSKISEETTRAKAAEKENADAIAAETARAKAAEKANADNIATLTSGLQTADGNISSLQSAVSANESAISEEATRAKAAESALSTSVNAINTTLGSEDFSGLASSVSAGLKILGSFKGTATEILTAMGGMISAPEKDYIVAASLTTLTVKAGAVFSVGGTIVTTEATTLTVSGASVGDDWKIYAYIGTDGVPAYQLTKVALTGNYFLLGGFHYGRVRTSTTAASVSEGIVPNSVWTMLHRPTCDPTGMAYAGNDLWSDIYIMSGSPVVSKYGASPKVNVTWYDAGNLLRAAGKRMPSYSEWCMLAEGSPEGQDGNNTYARSATTNTSAGTTGDVKYAISSLNIVDCVGRVWEWVDELCLDPTASSWAWYDITANAGYGDMYLPSNTALHALGCGGDWGSGVHGGARAVSASRYPWDSNAHVSGRGVCDSQ